MDLGLSNKKALVAGASSGLGFASAKALFDEGASVVLCSSNKDNIERAAKSLSEDKTRALPIVCDLTKKEQIDDLVKSAEDTFGKIDIVVTNCGGPPLGTHDSLTETEWEMAYNLTFMSTIRLIQATLPGMKERKFGRVITITSFSSKQPIDNLMLSNTYRAGLLGYTKTLCKEVAPLGITVNSVLPGYTKTERLEYFAKEISEKTGQSRDEIYKGWQSVIPVDRLGTPGELGAFVAYLASDKAGYITGTSTAIDGGRYAGLI
ncbi:MAG: SDR family oxidoreductase [candidate division Zixibacteria bacterium]|nr:SDR family oxidoreductase [candidate division Zixibacteria bacterium]